MQFINYISFTIKDKPLKSYIIVAMNEHNCQILYLENIIFDVSRYVGTFINVTSLKTFLIKRLLQETVLVFFSKHLMKTHSETICI